METRLGEALRRKFVSPQAAVRKLFPEKSEGDIMAMLAMDRKYSTHRMQCGRCFRNGRTIS